MPNKNRIPRSETVAFVAEHLKKDASIAMSELKKLGQAAGHNIYGLIVGLARKSLGLKRATPKAKRGPGRPPGKRGPGRPPGKRGPGRPPGTRGPGLPPGSGRRAPGRPPGRRGPGRPPGRRGPGRPPKSTAFAGLDGVVAHMKGLEREVASLRAALGRIADVAAGA